MCPENEICAAPIRICRHIRAALLVLFSCRGIVTADVLMQGLSRGAIAARKLKGVERDKEHEGYTGSAPYGEGKSLRPVEVVLIRVSITRN